PSHLGRVGERTEYPLAASCGKLAHLGLELRDGSRVAGEVPHLEQRGERIEVGVGERNRLLHRPAAVAGDEPGVPEWVPERLRNVTQGLALESSARRRDEQHVDVGSGTQLLSTVRPERDE